jgi:hypothetical protein
LDYDVFAVLSEYVIIHIKSATKSQTHWTGIETIFHCKKCPITTLATAMHRNLGLLTKVLNNEEISVAGAVMVNKDDTLT